MFAFSDVVLKNLDGDSAGIDTIHSTSVVLAVQVMVLSRAHQSRVG